MLPIHGSLNRVRENFARQFTPDKDGFVHRQRQRGAAMPVSAAERDDFVAAFDRGIGRLFWGVLAVVIAVMAAFQLWPDILPPTWRPWHEAMVAAGAALSCGTIWWRLSTAPDRVLERRAIVAAPLDAAARRRADFAGLPWTVLSLGALLMAGLIAQTLSQPGPTDWTYIAGGAVGLAFFALLGAIKWRVTRS